MTVRANRTWLICIVTVSPRLGSCVASFRAGREDESRHLAGIAESACSGARRSALPNADQAGYHRPAEMRLPDLDSLRCFEAAAVALNFRRAARMVALSPAAFSD